MALSDNETWELVRPPTDRDVIPQNLVYKLKSKTRVLVNKYKARYVAKVFKPVEEHDYLQTFAPISEPKTFSILLQL